jgi:drug/metabolite transporter (DMT)-like permease
VEPAADVIGSSYEFQKRADVAEELPTTSPRSSEEPPPLAPPPSPVGNRLKGLVLLLASTFFFSLMALAVKLASNDFGAGQALLFRCSIQASCAWLACKYQNIPTWGPEGRKFRCGFRGFVGSFATFWFFNAIVSLPLADATAIFFTSPVFSAFFSMCIGSDGVSRSEIVAVICAITGVMFISRPSFLFADSSNMDASHITSFAEGVAATELGAGSGVEGSGIEDGHLDRVGDEPSDFDINAGDSSSLVPINEEIRPFGVIAACFGAVLSGVVPITVRYCGPSVHFLSLTYTFGAFGVLVSLIGIYQHGDITNWPPLSNPYPYFVLICGGLASTFAQCLFNAGMQLERPTTSSLVRTLDVPLGAMYQSVIIGNPLSWSSCIGMGFTVGSTLMLLVVRMNQTRSDYKKVASNENLSGTGPTSPRNIQLQHIK